MTEADVAVQPEPSPDTADNFNETDNPYEFEENLIKPASQVQYDWLSRDPVLSNITAKQLLEVRLGLELVQLLDYLHLPDAKSAFLADIQAIFVVSRGVDGFWTRMMRTSISELKGWKQEDVDKKGFRWLFRKK